MDQNQNQDPRRFEDDQFGGGQYFYQPEKTPKKNGNINGWVFVIAIVAIFGILGWWFFQTNREKKQGKPIEVNNDKNSIVQYDVANSGEVSPITGLACENWNRRSLAIMQPADESARPAAGFSQADMVIEMPVITAGFTRLMGIYICNLPNEAGSMRSARHDFIHLAKGLDAIFVSWGRSESHSDSDPVGLAQGIMNRNEIDNINCNADAGKSVNACSQGAVACFRKEGFADRVDSGYSHPPVLYECAKEFGYRTENKFSGYLHQSDAPFDQRIEKGHLRIGYAGKFAVEYDYDKATNSYLRSWGGDPDVDRNNGERIAPRNIAVLMAVSEQIEGQYNNVQLGDPWYDTSDSGEAFYYIDGNEIRGKWKKDKSRIDSKLMFLNDGGGEIKFVPGQIWVHILEPGQNLKWKTEADLVTE